MIVFEYLKCLDFSNSFLAIVHHGHYFLKTWLKCRIHPTNSKQMQEKRDDKLLLGLRIWLVS